MHLNFSLDFDLGVDEVVELLVNKEFLQFKAKKSHTELLTADIIRHDDGALTSAVRRTMAAELIPANLQAFVGNQLEVRQTEAWAEAALSPGQRHGTFALEITGAPVRMSGNMVVRPNIGGSTLEYNGDVVAAVPLFASTVESAVGQAITKVLQSEGEYAKQWLASQS